MSNTFTDASGVVRLSGSWGELIVTESARISPAAVGTVALVITPPDGAAANGDDQIEVNGDTGGFFFVDASGSMGADFDTDVGSGYTLSVDGEPALRIGANVTHLCSVDGATDGVYITSHYAGEPMIHALDDKLSFFGSVPIAKPAGVAVSAAGIHAALVDLGLIGA